MLFFFFENYLFFNLLNKEKIFSVDNLYNEKKRRAFARRLILLDPRSELGMTIKVEGMTVRYPSSSSLLIALKCVASRASIAFSVSWKRRIMMFEPFRVEG